MNGRDCDIAIVGAGLAGGLIALALARLRPDVSVRLLESGAAPGGNHRWSWFESDLPAAGHDLVAALPAVRWDDGYEVRFPGYGRHLRASYRSLASTDFAAALAEALPAGAIRTDAPVAGMDRTGVTLASGERITARAVIDCRGFAGTAHLTGGWQVFMGRHLRTAVPHGAKRPLIMDAAVEQAGGYRFVYVLPLGPSELFVEDTYYQDRPTLDHAALSARIDAFCRTRGWDGEVLAHETGTLPVVAGGDFAAFQQEHRIAGVAVAGARGGFSHPMTSYTLPFAVDTALAVAAHADLPGEELATLLEKRARRHWSAMRFYRLLGAMLFGAALPEQRWRVFARFYRLDEGLIERFYAGRSTLTDRARILCGRPPVPIGRALASLFPSTAQPHRQPLVAGPGLPGREGGTGRSAADPGPTIPYQGGI